jgi:predicted ATPase
MRITKLELQDYKCFEKLTLDHLGDRVVLVGPNGCGKSAVLEAIAALKEFISTYDPGGINTYFRQFPLAQTSGTGWPAETPLPVRANQPFASVSADVELNEAEVAISGGLPTATVAVRIERTGMVTPISTNQNIAKVFGYFDPLSGIGVIDYIGPNRVFPSRRITNLNLAELSLEQQRRERIELPRQQGTPPYKFSSTKQFIISKQLEDLSHLQATGEQRDSLALLREIFEHFFGPKKLLGYREWEGEMQVAVQTPFGEHDIDQLSSGEKELFSILVNLFRIRSLPSVVLYDEPERHLNAGLESKIIPSLDKLQTKNQVWIASHGIELIGSVPMHEIIALKREGGVSEPERFRDEVKTNRVRLFEMLGAKTGLQLASNRIVFVEGKDSHADKWILDKLASPRLPGVLFVASGPSTGVISAGTHASLLVQQASKDAAFLMILDRDYRDEASMSNLTKKLNNRAFIWTSHEVENLLLAPDILLKILHRNGVASVNTSQEVEDALLLSAREQEQIFTYQWASYQIFNNTSVENEEQVAQPRDEHGFLQMIEKRRERNTTTLSTASVESILQDTKHKIQACFADGTWKQVLPGKEILQSFRKKYLPTLPHDLFKQQVIAAMVEDNYVPDEINRLCQFVDRQ